MAAVEQFCRRSSDAAFTGKGTSLKGNFRNSYPELVKPKYTDARRIFTGIGYAKGIATTTHWLGVSRIGWYGEATQANGCTHGGRKHHQQRKACAIPYDAAGNFRARL